ncbi:MAG TPA: histone deacetylase [Verrucomicrobiae bacterium]|jgi:acetoin utilization deacetylase AcuC-like enzyme|nr:histone deacetylase [Verrucomicrobiae bacterium]
MKIITDDACAGYSHPGHPEKPARVVRTLEKLRTQTELAITWAKPGRADDAAILRAHTPELLASLDSTQDFDADTPAYPGIANYARASAGAALEAMRSARKGETVFSLMRPPGHHATRNRIMGFCFLNNIAIAALDALASGVKRMAVFDFDVHHGNGTEDILLNVEGVAFFSIHQFPAYPGSGQSHVGGNCFNYPVPPSLPRAQYRDVFSCALEELKKFRPDLVGVSAGFDAYARDPLAQETLEAEDFFWLGEQIRALNLPTFSVLEGGYSRDLPELVFSYLRGLEGK